MRLSIRTLLQCRLRGCPTHAASEAKKTFPAAIHSIGIGPYPGHCAPSEGLDAPSYPAWGPRSIAPSNGKRLACLLVTGAVRLDLALPERVSSVIRLPAAEVDVLFSLRGVTHWLPSCIRGADYRPRVSPPDSQRVVTLGPHLVEHRVLYLARKKQH